MRNDLKEIPIYEPPSAELTNLANNENYYSNWNNIIKEQLQQIACTTQFFQYGTSAHEQLINNYSNYMNISPEQILVAPGSDGLIPLLINALTHETIITLKQDFFRYDQAAQILKRKNIRIDISPTCYDDIIDAANNEKAELILLSNPNNPLGVLHLEKDLIKILDNTNCYIIIDEAYGEYCYKTISGLINKYDKLIVLRTMSKAWGLAGLRVGYAISNKNIIEYLKAIQGPFTLSDVNANIAAEVLNHTEILNELVSDLLIVKDDFIKYLDTLPLEKVYDSYSNFVYIENNDAHAIHQALIDSKIAVSRFEDNGLRITIGTQPQMNEIKQCLSNYFKGD